MTSTRQRWRAETQGRGYFGSHVSRPVTDTIDIAVESEGIVSRKEKAMLSPQRWTPVRYKKETFFSCSHLAATGGGHWLEKESKRKTQRDGRVRSGHSSRGALTWNRVWRKKKKNVRKERSGEGRSREIERKREKACVEGEGIRKWREGVQLSEAYSGNERSRDARR